MHFEETAENVIRSRGCEDESRWLHRLFDLAWEYTLHEFPEFATYVGRSEYNHLWSDHALEAYERRNRDMEVPARVLATIERDRLSEADRVQHDLFKRGVEENLGGGGSRMPIGRLISRVLAVDPGLLKAQPLKRGLEPR